MSSKLRENDERKNDLSGRISVLSERITKLLATEVFYYFSEKLPFSQKLRYFQGSRFPQCCILSTALQCSLQNSVFKLIIEIVNVETYLKTIHRVVGSIKHCEKRLPLK